MQTARENTATTQAERRMRRLLDGAIGPTLARLATPNIIVSSIMVFPSFGALKRTIGGMGLSN